MPHRDEYPITHAVFGHVRALATNRKERYAVYMSRRLHNSVRRETLDATPHSTPSGVLRAGTILGHPLHITDSGPDLSVGIVALDLPRAGEYTHVLIDEATP